MWLYANQIPYPAGKAMRIFGDSVNLADNSNGNARRFDPPLFV
jgi:hypothetical protein